MPWFGKKKAPPVGVPPPSLDPPASVGSANTILLLTERADPPPVASNSINPENKTTAEEYWTEKRIEAAEFLWGEDNLSPGDGPIAATALADLPITVASQVLIPTAGLGGLTRVLAKHYGCWPTSMTPSPTLAALAQQRSDRQELSQKAAVTSYNPATVTFKANSFDFVAAHEILTTVSDKARLLQQMVRAAKRVGRVMITEIVLTELGASSLVNADRRSAEAGEALQAWLKLAVPAPQLCSHEQMMEFFLAINVDAEPEKISAVYSKRITSIWTGLSERLNAGTIPRSILPIVASDSERWAAFRTALDAEAIAAMRYRVKF